MARTTFTAEVLTPEGEVFNDEVEMVSTRTEVGSLGILANHQPLLGMLTPTALRLYKSETEIVTLAQSEGYVQVSDNHVLVLVQDAVAKGDLDVADLREKLSRAESAIESAEDGSEALASARRDKRRWQAFLEVAEDSAAS
ncbi:ATP synthase epsilon chain [Paraconexibacter sp. AEG42_29]|uniref:ATP synthase epsilon chain n=1 Tax=Paraconexibacter sp. AEG42_29 TaxID=2997339 RepID=A0AAU7ASY5_9ACTN